MNVLIYGPPGTGKTEFPRACWRERQAANCMRSIASTATATACPARIVIGRCRCLQAFLRGRPRTALLFDEVEDVFPGSSRELMSLFGQEDARASVNGKAWVNQTLEQNPVPVIWISNSIRHDRSPLYLRRFQFHLELKIPPPLVRENIIRKHLGGLDVSDAFITGLAGRARR
ncbi:AAA family ATPase [Cupriavidus basilensis]